MLRRHFVIQGMAAAAFAVPRRLLAQATVQTQPIDPFGQEITLAERPIVYLSGTGDWDTAYATLIEAFKVVQAFLDQAAIERSGPEMTIYTAIEDSAFNFQAAIPVAEPPKGAARNKIRIGTSPGGRALKFVHRGSFEELAASYDAISHFAEERQITAKELLIEEYVTDLLTAPPDKLIVNILVPLA